MRAKHLLLAAIVVGFCHAPVFAQDAKNGSKSADPAAIAADLEALQSETIMAQARLANVKVKDELNKYDPKATTPTSSSSPQDQGMPVVSEVYGAPTSLKARFAYADGAALVAKAGDRLPGGCTVKSIATDAVIANCTGRGDVVIGFAGSASPRTVPAMQGSANPILPMTSVPPMGQQQPAR